MGLSIRKCVGPLFVHLSRKWACQITKCIGPLFLSVMRGRNNKHSKPKKKNPSIQSIPPRLPRRLAEPSCDRRRWARALHLRRLIVAAKKNPTSSRLHGLSLRPQGKYDRPYYFPLIHKETAARYVFKISG